MSNRYEIIVDALKSESLQFGQNRINRVDKSPDNVFLYKAIIEGFSEIVMTSYVCILVNQSTEKAFLDCGIFLESVSSKDSQIIIAYEGQVYTNDIVVHGRLYPVIPIDNLFSRIVSLPTNFRDLFAEKNTEDFTSRNYNESFLERQLKIWSVPQIGFDDHLTAGSIVTAQDYFLQWSSARGLRKPILVLGDRGAGKTWQLFDFCVRQLERHIKSPWEYGPALYLHLKEVNKYFAASGEGMPSFAQIVFKRYPAVKFLWDDKMLEGLMNAGHTILCLDSVDEIFKLPSSDQVREHIRRISSALTANSRFIMTCRTTHFDSIDELLHMETWPGATLRNTFEVVELLPFDQTGISSYISKLKLSNDGSIAKTIDDNVTIRPLWRQEELDILQITLKQPAMIGKFAELIREGTFLKKPMLDWLLAIIDRAVLGFNQEKRTLEYLVTPDGTVTDFTLEDRRLAMETICWYMAERGIDCVDIRKLPSWVSAYCGVKEKELQRDLRSQTLFEMVDVSNEGPQGLVQFTIRDSNAEFSTFTNLDQSNTQLTIAKAECPVLATSVAGALMGAKHMLRAWRISLNALDIIDPTDFFLLFSWKPIAPACACILSQMLESEKHNGTTLQSHLINICNKQVVHRMKKSSSFRLHPKMRYLTYNLTALKIPVNEQLSQLVS